MRRWLRLWDNLVRPGRADADLDAELRATLDLLADEHERGGLPAVEARRAARLQLGSLDAIKASVRDVRAGAFIDTLWLDLRYGARQLARSPLFALTAILSLALGTGATTAIFTVANGLLFRAATGVSDPSTLVDIVRLRRDRSTGVAEISYPDYVEIGRRATMVGDVFGYRLTVDPVSFAASALNGAERAFVSVVTPNYFQALGVRAEGGRLFDRGDSALPGASPIVVLGHAFWTRRFDADRSVVGRTVRLNGQPFTIVGIADAAFAGTSVVAPDFWVPTSMASAVRRETTIDHFTNRRHAWLMLGARLRPGTSRGQASSEIAAIGRVLDRDLPLEATVSGMRPSGGFTWSVQGASPIPAGLRGIATAFLGLLLAIVGTVLAIACANVAGVLLARATSRSREIAVRTAIGASRSRVIRQLLTETSLLVLIGGAVGLGLARVITSALVALLPASSVPVHVSAPLDARVAVFSLVLSLLAALLAGLTPALQASKTDVIAVLKDDAPSGHGRRRARHVFVAAQVALSTLLVVTAVLLARGLQQVSIVDRGFDVRGVHTASLDLGMGRYDEDGGRQVARELIERVSRLPGVQTASVADRAPSGGAAFAGGITVAGAAPPEGAPYFLPNATAVEPGYFPTLRIPMLSGRDFGPGDSHGADPVVIVGASMARRFWPGRSAIGESLLFHRISMNAGETLPPTSLRIVGVVGDVGGSRQAAPLAIYLPFQQRYSPRMTVLVRARPGQALANELRAVVASINHDLVLLDSRTLEAQLRGPVETQLRVSASVAGSVGLLGLLLAGVGVYGVTAYAVSRRTREIGIRLSLGAGRLDVVKLVLRQGMTLVGLGAAIGLALGLAAGRLLASGPLRVPAPDVVLVAVTSAAVGAVGLIACWVPAWRATRLRAMDALRRD